jgi:hypothetical protein
VSFLSPWIKLNGGDSLLLEAPCHPIFYGLPILIWWQQNASWFLRAVAVGQADKQAASILHATSRESSRRARTISSCRASHRQDNQHASLLQSSPQRRTPPPAVATPPSPDLHLENHRLDTSSNIFVESDMQTCLSDFSLSRRLLVAMNQSKENPSIYNYTFLDNLVWEKLANLWAQKEDRVIDNSED